MPESFSQEQLQEQLEGLRREYQARVSALKEAAAEAKARADEATQDAAAAAAAAAANGGGAVSEEEVQRIR